MGPAECLACAIRLLRALEAHQWHLVETIVKQIPEATSKSDLGKCADGHSSELDKLREWTIQLAKQEVLQELRDLQEDDGDIGEG